MKYCFIHNKHVQMHMIIIALAVCVVRAVANVLKQVCAENELVCC